MTSEDTIFAIIGAEIYTPSYQSKGNIFVRGDKIESIRTEPLAPSEHQSVTTIDATGCSVIPGLIDAQVHGGGGADTLISNTEDLEKAARAHAAHGVTSLVLTIPSAGMERINRSLEAVGYLVDNPVESGSRILGSYVEGKFGSHVKSGAQNTEYISPPNFEDFHTMWAASDGTIKIIAIAPENDEGLKFTKHLATYSEETYNNITVAMGHTNATYDQATAAIDAGITRATHTYNGMSGMHQRNLGAVEAIYSHPKIHAELIVDEQHVKPIWAQTLIMWKGIQGVGLITDCTALAGVSKEEWMEYTVYESDLDAYRLKWGILSATSNLNYYIKNGAIWINLREADARLYGGMITLMEGLRNVVSWGYTLEEAVTMASLTPAKSLGVDKQKGSIAPGKDADLVILDTDLKPKAVMIEGKFIKNELPV
jgi:N-acetylglucosamine-6-phosphate deacetylase